MSGDPGHEVHFQNVAKYANAPIGTNGTCQFSFHKVIFCKHFEAIVLLRYTFRKDWNILSPVLFSSWGENRAEGAQPNPLILTPAASGAELQRDSNKQE